jgi:hypothetical protein
METENFRTLEYGRGILQLGFASCPISWSAVKYLPSDICIRLFGWPNILFCTFADFYEITSFLTYRAANPIDYTYFPYYDYDYLLVNKKKKTFIGKINTCKIFYILYAIQRGNAASIRGTFTDFALLSEIFALHVM